MCKWLGTHFRNVIGHSPIYPMVGLDLSILWMPYTDVALRTGKITVAGAYDLFYCHFDHFSICPKHRVYRNTSCLQP